MARGDINTLSDEQRKILSGTNSVIVDMRGKFLKYGSLSERQWKYAKSLHDKEEAKKNEKPCDEIPAKLLSVGGNAKVRVLFTGLILAFKTVETNYGPTEKMMLRDYRNFKIWGTRPKGLKANVGDCVQIEAVLYPNRNDPTFGYFSRPTKPRLMKRREDMKSYKKESEA